MAYHILVIAVPEGNPTKIRILKDLTRPSVRIVFGYPMAAAIGKLGNKVLKKNKIYDDVQKNVIAHTATVNELVVYLCMKHTDASMIWS